MVREYGIRQKLGLIIGIIIFFIFLIVPIKVPTAEARMVLAVTALMAIWWSTEALPIPAVSLLPIGLFPLLGVMETGRVTIQYANHLIFLFMGGFLIAIAIQKWDLHKRIALNIIRYVGTEPKKIILGFMLATAFLSMWISNTATCMMMITVATALLTHIAEIGKKKDIPEINFAKGKFNFSVALILGVAFAANVGGIGTLIGTPPNALLAAFIEENFAQSITFLQWMTIGVPVAVLLVPIIWYYLVNISTPIELDKLPGGDELVREQVKELGPMKRGEKIVLIVFSITGFLWITRSFLITPFLPFVEDSTIAIIMAITLFLIPVNLEEKEFALDWEWGVRIPWDVLLLLGGGFALAKGIETTGLGKWVASLLSYLSGSPFILLLIGVIALMLFLSQFTSNTATTSMMLPVILPLAKTLGAEPLSLMIPATIAVSGVFMMPVGTPPNAIAYGTGYVSIPQMVKNGFGLEFINIAVIVILAYLIIFPLLGIYF